MEQDAATILTENEKEVLRLLLVRSSVKEIAREIDRSVDTVDQRLLRARRKLGVSRSMDAAHILARAEGAGTYGTGAYPASVPPPEVPSPTIKAVPERGSVRRPFPSEGRPWNDLSVGQRLVWIAAGAVAIAITTLALVSLAESFGRVARVLQ